VSDVLILTDVLGEPFAVVDSMEDAFEEAQRHGVEDLFDEYGEGVSEVGVAQFAANPPRKRRLTVNQSMKALPIAPLPTVEEIDEIPLHEAAEKLRALLPKKRRYEGRMVPVRQYRSDAGILKAILGQNFKTEKRVAGRNVRIQGLNLLPGMNWALAKGMPTLAGRENDFCAGASGGCRQGCLVGSGRNADPFAHTKKLALTDAFVREPHAFARILVERLRRWESSMKRRGAEPAVRLNVYSDIVWERLWPSLFEHFMPRGEERRLQFYDYTKVPGRGPRPLPNYDLTFSLSEKNLDLSEQALRQGMRLAVVFIGEVPEEGSRILWNGQDYPVVDGDKDDFRIIDPAPSIVALKYKPVKGVELANLPRALYNFVKECRQRGIDPTSWEVTPEEERLRRPRSNPVPKTAAFLVHGIDLGGGLYAMESHYPTQTNAFQALEEQDE